MSLVGLTMLTLGPPAPRSPGPKPVRRSRIDVACSYCRAAPGTCCISSSGGRTHAHTARVVAAKAAAQ